jgi:CubicO group peptidase (beta-lactamase class C family)
MRFRAFGLMTALPLVLPACATAQTLTSRFDGVFAPLAGAKTPGLAVLIRERGSTVFERGYGLGDLRTEAKIDARTDFRLASCTKQFTATAIMLLVRDGKLRYGDTLGELFPDFPEYGRKITVHELLTHTSGLPDYEELMEVAEKNGAPAWSPSRQIQDAEVLQLLERAKEGKFAPGTQWAYSNSGYVVLGLIVAKASGEPFGRFLHDRIFAPLGMGGTLVYEQGVNTAPRRAFGYSLEGGRFVATDQSATSATQGDGGVYSNLDDLARWDEALQRNTLMSAAEMRTALTPVRLSGGAQPRWPLERGDDNLAPGKPVSYGFGWFLDPYEGHERMWHFGSTIGFRTAIERFPKDWLTVAVLCNRTDLDPGALALRSAQIVLNAHQGR